MRLPRFLRYSIARMNSLIFWKMLLMMNWKPHGRKFGSIFAILIWMMNIVLTAKIDCTPLTMK